MELPMRNLRIRSIAGIVKSFLATAALAMALGSVEGRADMVFVLSDVTFDDGTSATGTFKTNDALNALLDWDITTVNGSIAGFHYTPLTAPTSNSSIPSILVVEDGVPGHLIQLTFDGGLTAAGAQIKMNDSFASFEQFPDGNFKRVVIRGSVVAQAVPEPSSLLTSGVAAIAGLGMWRRRRRAV